MKRIYVIRGGFIGPDGYLFSGGMDALAARIRLLPDVECDVWNWSSWTRIHDDLLADDSAKRVLVGYSGGGSRATWIADYNPRPSLDLVVGYDPSPWYQTCANRQGRPFHLQGNVKKALCYYNTSPRWGMVGGGKFLGPQVTYYKLNQSHMMVQFNEQLHQMTLAAIAAL
jgi:hypothetical protein